MKRVMLVSTAFFLLASFGQTQALAEKIYWTAGNKIQRANADGTRVEDVLVDGFAGFYGIALNAEAGTMYWADAGNGQIMRGTLDGSYIQAVVTGLDGPYGVALDLLREKMYWTDIRADRIQRANFDGTDMEDVVPYYYLGNPTGIALDTIEETLYWADDLVGSARVRRANFDGSQIADVVQGIAIGVPLGVAFDTVDGKLYWTDPRQDGEGRILRANVDGSGMESVLTNLDYPADISIDALNGKIYWAESDARMIRRANLDGTGIETLVAGLPGLPTGIALDLTPIPEPPSLWSLIIGSAATTLFVFGRRRATRAAAV